MRYGKSPETHGGEKATIVDAHLAALIMREIPQIQGIEVFGSLARSGKGNDIDLLLLTDDVLSIQFFNECEKDVITVLGASSPKERRRRAAAKVLGPAFNKILKSLTSAKKADFDVFLAPPDWRDRTPSTHPFWSQLNRDAVRIA